MKASIFTIILILFAGAVAAAGIDGKWEGTYERSMGKEPIKKSYDFKSEGNRLTGTALTPTGKRVEIKNGKIEGNDIAFDVLFEMSGIQLTFIYRGVLSGDEIKMSYGIKANAAFHGGSVSFGTGSSSEENKSGQPGMPSTTSLTVGGDGTVINKNASSQIKSREFIVRRVE